MTFEISREFMIKTLAQELNKSEMQVKESMRKKNYSLRHAEIMIAARAKVNWFLSNND